MITLTHIPARNAVPKVGKELTPDSVGEGAEVEEGGHGDLIERESKEDSFRACVREKNPREVRK